MPKPAKKRPTASAPATVPTTKSSRHSAGDPEPKRDDRGSKHSRVSGLAAITHRRNDRSDDEGHRLAAALGARLSCRRRAEAPQAEARLEDGGRPSGLPDRERR